MQPIRLASLALILGSASLAMGIAASAAVPISPEQVEAQVKKLVSQMTLQEKMGLTAGVWKDGYIGYLPGISRLGIPAMTLTDGPAGIRNGQATAFPAPISMASSWDPLLIERVGAAMGEEARAKGQNVLLAPCINILRVPQGGRSFEGYGEDPYLVGKMAVGFIKGVQSEGVSACAKHYATNNQETERGSISSEVGERALREIYLPAFKATVQEAGVWSVMAAYNKLNGTYCSENDILQNEILKNEWGFKGFVVSDWGATHSTVEAANGGLDLEMPTGQYFNSRLLGAAMRSGELKESTIDDKVSRILRSSISMGQWNSGWKTGAEQNTQAHQNLALEAARAGMVLLKNNGILPLKTPGVKTIAVIGPNAEVARYCGGGSAYVEPPYVVSPLDALESRANRSRVAVRYAQGIDPDSSLSSISTAYLAPPNAKVGQHGLKAEYFNNMNLSGKPALTRVDQTVDFNWYADSPAPELDADNFSIRWTGTLTPPTTGTYALGTTSDDGSRLYIDGKLIVDNWGDHAAQTATSDIYLEKGKAYPIKLEFYENAGDASARLGWIAPGKQTFPEAVTTAKSADVVVVYAGTSSGVESEGFDRASLRLPGQQDALIKAVAAANKNTIVVLSSGSAILMDPWVDQVAAVAQSWFAGMEGGTAIAEMLFGDFSPSGRLPLTYPKRWEDCAAYGNFPGSGGTVSYEEGVLVGYRHFDTHKVEPLFPFGFGLSYTSFQYSDMQISPSSATASNPRIRVSLQVKNTGRVPGAEVIQLYVHDAKSSVERPTKELKSFQKLYLKPGESGAVSFELDSSAFAFYSVDKKGWVVEPGAFDLMVGASSRDIRLSAPIDLK